MYAPWVPGGLRFATHVERSAKQTISPAVHTTIVIATHAGVGDVAFAWIVSKRPFTGNWEYMLDEALWTSPPTLEWSGAGLIDRGERSLGVFRLRQNLAALTPEGRLLRRQREGVDRQRVRRGGMTLAQAQ